MTNQYISLYNQLGYHFQDEALLELALSHRSVGGKNNERLEFLGDSILNYVIGEDLYHRFSDAQEGQLSRLRARMVKGATLAELGREFGLSEYMKMGSGELKSGGYRRDSILADAVEAIIGAIHLENHGDMAACKRVILNWYQSRLEKLSVKDTLKDPKTRLQEFLQSRQQPLPQYEVVNVKGQAHQQTFFVECRVESLEEVAYGKGTSRRIAEQVAAGEALILLGVDTREEKQ
ncbi:ribonuclease III [Litoribrevibacter albus]|uniref:Ribonuclease 3 n=1 Tax=Litoribrevibacter albus TaxID=1473156 RepID=A0AA37SB20_9GAMM|nr:ribonuclease III [Litoribrevibacter albus]GLQ31203.1 ribonuclease 3 [Litoribrevibacter albus]